MERSGEFHRIAIKSGGGDVVHRVAHGINQHYTDGFHIDFIGVAFNAFRANKQQQFVQLLARDASVLAKKDGSATVNFSLTE